MEFAFSAAEERFREEVRRFLDHEVPQSVWDDMAVRPFADRKYSLDFTRALAAKGWLGIAWPKEVGGAGKPTWDQAVFAEEMGKQDVPQMAHTFGINIVGPMLILFGTEAQKKFFLPKILHGEVTFCLGYSEPNAGTDLASLQTSAVREGDEYVINGQKLWTNEAEYAQYCWLAVRTDPSAPKHKGISLLMVPMDTPGITVRPVVCMVDYRVNEVYFNNVRVPSTALVGKENLGWYHVAVALDFERGMMGGSTSTLRAKFEHLVDYVRNSPRGQQRLATYPVLKHRLAEIATEIEVARLLAYRVSWMHSSHKIPNAEASMSKLFTSEMGQRLAGTAMEVIGLEAQLCQGDPRAPYEGCFPYEYQFCRVSTFGGGSSEVQRNIIATRGLGLPS